MIELMRSEAGTWTLLLTLPGGATCVLAHGENWESVMQPVESSAT